MFRVISYIILIILVGLGFAWLANNPTDIIIPLGGQRVVVPLLLAVSILIIALLALWFIWWLISAILRSPFILNRKIKESRKRRGEEALSQGLIAVLSGDSANAYRLSKRANKFLGEETTPLHQLLTVRSLLLNDDHEGAIRLYEKMRKNPETKLLALQGLYQEAIKSSAYEAASQYAEEAVKIAPTLNWANQAILDKHAIEGDWDKALALFERTQKALPKVQRKSHTTKHLNAVLLTGEAMDIFENRPDEARVLALKATKLDPNFVPAATIASTILYKLNQTRAGNKIIENLWRRTPHPDLSKIYVNAVLGERATERLKRAQKLASFNSEHFESLMIVARTAFEAGQIELAYTTAEKALKIEPCESAYLLLADIEEVRSGEQGRIRQWLAKAVHAERDFVWIADSVIFDQWAPVSPISGRVDAFEWKKPVHYLSQLIQENTIANNEPTEHKNTDITDADIIENKSSNKHKPISSTKTNKSENKKFENLTTIDTDNQKETPQMRKTSSHHNERKILDNKTLETPFADATFIEEERNTIHQPTRLNVDDPGIEDGKKAK